jgi:hypothetical protein
MGDRSSSDRGDAYDLLRVVVERRKARRQHISKRAGQRLAADGACREQLLGKERIAIRAREHLVGHLALRYLSQDPGHLLHQLALIEAGKLDALDRGEAGQFRDEPNKRMALMNGLDPGRRHDQPALGLHRSRQVDDEVERRGVGPLQVFDRDHDRIGCRSRSQEVADGGEQASLSTLSGIRFTTPGCDLWREAAKLGAD